MERTILFLGPSLQKDIAQRICPQALICGPAAQGDVDFAARQLGAKVIAVIDGAHRSQLSVWHTEIMSALESGVRVLGAASMGALRAVEMAPWGSEYFGEIANWYAAGKIDADDEVCLAHDDSANGYKARSVPLVNVRGTLICCGFTSARKREILAAAKSIFYADRTWNRIFQASEIRGMEKVEITACELDLKAADALHLCHQLVKLPPRKEPERKVQNANIGYSEVFRVNDAKVLHKGKVMRMHEIAGDDPYIHRLAGYRGLALEFCKLVGITPRVEATEDDDLPICDDTLEERVTLANEERMLDRAREWMSCCRCNFGDTFDVNNFLRTQGLYQKRKDRLWQI